MLALLEQSAARVARVADPDRRAGWEELRNKVEAFRAFEHVDSLLGMSVLSPFHELVERAGALPPPLCVWAAEGIAYHVTAARWDGDRGPYHLLKDRRLPAHLQVPLHAGMGCALGAAILDAMRERDFDDRRRALVRFERACENNAQPDHLAVALEALGFAAQSMFSNVVPPLAAAIGAVRPSLLPFFWHGAGRALYFAPSASLRPAGAQAPRPSDVPPTVGDDLNLIAGYSWAATLVNLRHPHVLEPLVGEFAAEARLTSACRGGIESALEIWQRCAPYDRAIDAFRAHVPDRPGMQRAWRRVVSAVPLRRAAAVADLFAVAVELDAAGARP